jgi:hypothetical protein
MSKASAYRQELARLSDWDVYLLDNSGLPGPRANLELAQAAADEGDEPRFRRWLAHDASRAPARVPANSPEVFLVVCGAIGLGRLLAEGRLDLLGDLRRLANDPRWRVREAVAMGLQRWGDADMGALLQAMAAWAGGNFLEQRAVVAALCEPRLLARPGDAREVLALLNRITEDLRQAVDRKRDDFRVLRQALGYGWSVAVAALPGEGKVLMESWFASPDRDIRWIMRENLKKTRLARADAAWVANWRGRV